MYAACALYLGLFEKPICGNSSVVEHLVANEKVASSNLVSRSLQSLHNYLCRLLFFEVIILCGIASEQLVPKPREILFPAPEKACTSKCAGFLFF